MITSITAILTVHNQENIIKDIYKSIQYKSSGCVTKLLVLFDGCTDRSEEIVRSEEQIIPTEFYTLDNVFETKANNFGLKLVQTPYAVIIQDDCLITEWGYDLGLLIPMEKWNNVFAVSGRNSHNIRVSGNSLDYYDTAGSGTPYNYYGTFYVRGVVNRGPLLLRMDVVDHLNYFDETFYPQNSDDHDLCIRAYNVGWICGCKPVNFVSERNWGGTRKGDGKWIAKAIEKNQAIIRERHIDFISKDYPNEDRNILK